MNHFLNSVICSTGFPLLLGRSYWSMTISLMRSAGLVLVVFLSLSLCFPGVSSGRAIGFPGGDVTPPEIKHTPPAELTAVMPIQATELDNVGDSDDTLMCRGAGDSEFQHVKMLEVFDSDIYALELPETAGTTESIISFRQPIRPDHTVALPAMLSYPYLITVPVTAAMKNDITQAKNEITQAPAAEPVKVQVPERNGVSKWVWIGLGVVAVGALAGGGASGGGNDNNVASAGSIGNSGNSGTGTGTVTITAPVPLP